MKRNNNRPQRYYRPDDPRITRHSPILSTGHDVTARGTVDQLAEKYLHLSEEAYAARDYVAAELHSQQAAHYEFERSRLSVT